MRAALRRAFVASFALAGWGGAWAQESLDDLDKPKPEATPVEKPATAKKAVEANGYVSNRLTGGWIDPEATLVPTRDQPSIQELLEANLQLRVTFGKAFLYADLSAVFQGGWLFYDDDGAGNRTRVDDHDVSSLKPFVALSELYLNWSPKPWLNLLVGKRRVVWGSGFAFNPTDLLNPPRDPTNPNFQRAGGWIARIEAPFEKFTVTLAAAPSVLYQTSGLPSAVLRYPSYPVAGVNAPDSDFHYLLAARLYALVYNSDLNLIYYFSNQFQNGFKNKSRGGVSFSRYFFTDYELHVEALLQTGSARSFADHYCASGLACDLSTAIGPTKLDSSTFFPRLLVGGRYQFRDESLISLEYYYQADGYSDQEFEDFARLLAKARPLLASGAIPTGMGPGSGGSAGALQTYFSFDPLRRHYLIASYSKPKIADDWTIGATLILGLRDFTGIITPSVSWSATEWLTLSLTAYVPIRGIPVGQVTALGKSYGEYSLTPFDARALFEARAYY